MTVLHFPNRRAAVAPDDSVRKAREGAIIRANSENGRDLADLCAPIVEPFRLCQPDLAQHLCGAFLRWQTAQIKTQFRDDQIAIGLALAASIEGFTVRMDELQFPYDPPGGGQAA